MKRIICSVMIITLILLSGCSAGKRNTTKQSVTQPNTTQAVTTLSMSNSKSEKTKSLKITNKNKKVKKDKASKKKYKKYKDLPGYKEYISDRNEGSITSFCGMVPSIYDNKKARAYYKKNSRKAGNFLVTNYLDGICINKVINLKKWDGKISEKIDGSNVIKLGSNYSSCNGRFSDLKSFTCGKKIYSKYSKVFLPKTIKYIDNYNIASEEIRHSYIVDKDNPYYTDDGSVLYVFDKNDKKHEAHIYSF